jgi:hypothetical protein
MNRRLIAPAQYSGSTNPRLRRYPRSQMRIFAIAALSCLFVTACPRGGSVIIGETPKQRFDEAIAVLARATTDEDRFYALDDAAKESFQAGNMEDARKYAKGLLALLPKFEGNWNFGNAIQDANVVLGRIALREGRIDDAKRYLIEAGNSPGSPQLNSFGPNMSLARDMLEKGEGETVLQYFELCRGFWKMDRGRLDEWRNEVKAGRTPQFGANLVY